MNKNRLIAGLFIAVVVALLLSVYVYRAFERASAVRPAQTATNRRRGRPPWGRRPPGRHQYKDNLLAG